MALRGILLAAGSSRRFGGDKLLHPLHDAGGKAAVALESASRLLSVLPDTLAVVRPGASELQRQLEAAGCAVTVCPRADEGMGCSLAHAISASGDVDGWVVALADMPFIDAASIQAVVAALQEGAAIAMPVHAGQRGHPVGFSACLRAELEALRGDQGARGVVQRHADLLRLVPVNDIGIIRDIDTREDLPGAAASE